MVFEWLTKLIEKQTVKKRSEFWRKQEILQNKLGPDFTEEMDRIDASIRKWDEEQTQSRET